MPISLYDARNSFGSQARQSHRFSTLEGGVRESLRRLSNSSSHRNSVLEKVPTVHKRKLSITQEADKESLSLQDPQVLPALFGKCAALTPDNIAVVNGEHKLTYRELDELSNQFAHYLQKVHNVQRGDMVCVAADRSIKFVVFILAILKCGAAYVPIDVKEPLQRRRDIIEDASPKLILVQEEYLGDFDFPNCVSTTLGTIAEYSPEPVQVDIHSHDIAVVFYTSGSTGRPKGVLLPHLAITGLISSPRYLKVGPEDRVLSSSSIAFDAASFEIWLALANSASLICIDYETIINPEAFADFLDQQAITVMWITSALFDQVVSFKPDIFKKVKYLMSGGDVVNPKTVYKVLNNENGRPNAFLNGYGPTETGIIATFEMITELSNDEEPLPIGKAVADTILYVLDENQQPVKAGEPGELYIGGPRLALGYLNLPERSAQSFIPNPFTGNPTDKLYRTGDLVSFRPDGSLAFNGRADRQIKFRGFRLELDGIENTLVRHPDVANAAIKMVKLNGEKALASYVQPEDPSKSFSVADYKAYLNEKMPSYSVPRFVIVMDKLPVTQRGKIDRKKLPDPVVDEPSITRTNIIKPRNETEKIIYNAWSAQLGVKDFSVRDDFFELGGSSILLPSVYATIRKQTMPFSFEAFLKNPTVESLAQIINANGEEEQDELKEAATDAVLDTHIQPSWSSPQADTGSVFMLTGATGFLGAHLLKRLLDKTDSKVYCLVRPGKSQSTQERLHSALKRFKVDISQNASKRIHTIAGDLSEPRLGINVNDHRTIVDNCTHIIHCGAFVNHILPYSRLKAANCESTNELIKISMTGRQKKLAFISTASAVTECNSEGNGYEGHVGSDPAGFFGGYALSKWVSERLMEQAFERGMEGLILRPGNIFANRTTGATSPAESNFALLMMNAYLESGLAPDLNLGFEAVPVDQLAEAIVAITLGGRNHAALNLTNPKELSLQEYVQVLSELRENGKPIEIIPFQDWKRRVIDELPESSPLYSLALYFQDDEPAAEILRFETRLAQAELASHGIEYPKDYKNLLKAVV